MVGSAATLTAQPVGDKVRAGGFLLRAAAHLIDRKDLHLERLLATEGKKLAREIGSAPAGGREHPADIAVDTTRERTSPVVAACGERGVGDDREIMSARSNHSSLKKVVQRFDVALRELAIELARTVLAKELSLRTAPNLRKRSPVTRRKVRAQRGAYKAPATVAPPSVARPPETANDRSQRVIVPTTSTEATTELFTAEGMPAQSSPRRRWTREQVVSELGAWLLAGQPVEAAFVKRHGPKGLVAAASKFFGRFDAALNTANLAIAGRVDTQRKAKRSELRETRPSLRELARQQQQRRRTEAAGAM